MKKNLLIFHLESIDTLHFCLNEECFPNIRNFLSRCVNVKYHYSNATSTFMSMNDLLYGKAWNRFEQTISYGNKIDFFHDQSRSLFDFYEEEGYYTKMIEYPKSAEHFNIKEIVQDSSRQYISKSRADFYEKISFAVNQNRFAIYIWDATSHLNCSDENHDKYKRGYDRRMQGYLSVDKTFGVIISQLENIGKMEETVIVLFGDHGDDYWFHGLEGGYAHGTLPYANIILTPLFIYDGSSRGTDTNHIIPTKNIGEICKELTDGNSVYNVVKIYSEKYVFSRNLFAAQRKSKYSYRLEKGYAVANKKYILILREKGYEMYYINLDIENSANILDFFRISAGKIKPFYFYRSMLNHRMIHFHFLNFENEEEIRDIKKNFYLLRNRMIYELNCIYEKQEIEETDRMKYANSLKIHYRNKYSIELMSLLLRGIRGRIKARLLGNSVWDETI